ncbi:DNA-binding protein [Allohahella sp. A8]|uniref:DNA-binding protein n=1 Tax=Allohahella sp. A8 TaxID=3141461 RepID=UPI003A7FFC80
MARSGVSYADVAKAANAIRAAGQEATIDRVREALGTGSKSTLAPLLRRWKAAQGEKKGAGREDLPDELLTAVRHLRELAQQSADEQIEQARMRFNEQEEVLRQQLVSTEGELSALQHSHETLTHAHDELQGHHEQLIKKNQQSEASAAAQRAELAEVRQRLSERQADYGELKTQLGHVRSQAEHYQQAVAEERRLEREQVQQLRSEWQLTRDDWGRRMAADAAALLKSEKAYDTLLEDHRRIELEKSALQGELERNQWERQSLQEELAARNDELAALRSERAAAAVTTAKLLTAREHLEHSVDMLTSRIDALELRAAKADDLADRLRSEHALALQAKIAAEAEVRELRSRLDERNDARQRNR